MPVGTQILHMFTIPIQEIEITHSLSGGKGGQNVNKVYSKVTLRWNVQKSDF